MSTVLNAISAATKFDLDEDSVLAKRITELQEENDSQVLDILRLELDPNTTVLLDRLARQLLNPANKTAQYTSNLGLRVYNLAAIESEIQKMWTTVGVQGVALEYIEAKAKADEEQIRERAYYIWQNTGREDAQANWLQAEQEMASEKVSQNKVKMTVTID